MRSKGSNDGAEPGDLVYYYLEGVNTTELYNDVLVKNEDGKSTSTANTFHVTGLPAEYVKPHALSRGKLIDLGCRTAKEKPSTLINARIEEFTDQFKGNKEKGIKRNPAEAWKYLIEKADKLSVRERLLQG